MTIVIAMAVTGVATIVGFKLTGFVVEAWGGLK